MEMFDCDCIILNFIDYIFRVRIVIQCSVREYRVLLFGDAQLKNLKMIVLCAVYLQNFWEKVEKNIKC